MIEAQIIDRLRRAGLSLCTVESCTGGLVAYRITRIPGASGVFWGSLIAYRDEAKEMLVGVPSELLWRHGAVSPEVARELARLGAEKCDPLRHKAVAISTTGVAGPGGATPERPVGLCYLGLALPNGSVLTREVRLDPVPERADAQQNFSTCALEFLLENLP
ncbi:MAG: CinA family protein [Oligoflexia bacterium]|nr:CinA family protein [Oligoflexia bacterium]